MRKVGNLDRSMRGFSWCVRRASARSLAHAPPFSTAGRPMRLDRRGVDRQGHAVFSAVGQRLEDSLPASALGPTIEPVVDRRVRTILRRAITPACAALEHMYDAADDAPIILALGASQVGRQVRRHSCPLPVVQPEQTCSHQNLPVPNHSEPGNQSPLIEYRP